jgi:glycosyltransferase involved in cell wall biosynthesis
VATLGRAPRAELDIVIPVYNERENIVRVIESLRRSVVTPFRVLICYDRDDDDTLVALNAYHPESLTLTLVKNRGQGALGAVLEGFRVSSAAAVLVFPADDDYNAPRLDRMMDQFERGCEIVAASRLMRGGCMRGAPWLKAVLIRTSAFVLHRVAGVPTHDPSNGFRLFSRRVIESIPIESAVGFAYSIEFLVKCHRLGWKIGEVPVEWHERTVGQSRFRLGPWLPQYFRWFCYALATTFLRRGPSTVRLRQAVGG